MTTPVSRYTVRSFLQAFASRDPAQLAPLLHDEVSWTVFGPVELIRFCGERRGKAAVLATFGRADPGMFRMTRYHPEILLVDGDRCATLAHISGVMPQAGRRISYRATQFVRFKDDKVIESRSILDSFDMVEQVLGHPIKLIEGTEATMAGGLVAV